MRDQGIAVRGLSVSYGSVRALDDVTFAAPRGAITALIGPNGAGKSTAVRAILGLVPIETGELTLDGVALDRACRQRIASVSQQSSAAPDFPIVVEDLVGLGRLPHVGLLGRFRARDRSVVDEAIRRTGLSSIRRHPVGRLSGGQLQRVQLARALAQEPSAFILDEPFRGVDEETTARMLEVLQELAAKGTTVLMVEHVLDRIHEHCQYAVELRRSVIGAGPPCELLRHRVAHDTGHVDGADARSGRP